MKRFDFLERVQRAAAAGRAHCVHAQRSDYGKYEPDDRAELLDRFAREVIAVGGNVHHPRDAAELTSLVTQLAGQAVNPSVLVWSDPALERLGIYALLDRLRIPWLDDSTIRSECSGDRGAMLDATLGITAVSAAIAETGSIVMQSGAGRSRSASLLPPVHLAIVEARLVLPDLFDYFGRLGETLPDTLPGNITFITGPSKTGDLELRLVTGVHGPREWHVALVEF
jgi:L-lactate dehydrogenase complex protein LldG